jgi:hypothetical protein
VDQHQLLTSQHLNLDFVVWFPRVLHRLGMMSLMNLPSLASLNISGCVAITDIGIMMVAQLTNLTNLEMPWCLKVTNIGLSALTPLTKLASLNISGCQLITEQGIACLGTLTSLRRLGLLNLGYSKVCVTDAALQKLSALTKLESLNLGLNIGSMQVCQKVVTDVSMQLISSRFKQLTQLGLMSLDVSDDGVKMLAQLSNLKVRGVVWDTAGWNGQCAAVCKICRGRCVLQWHAAAVCMATIGPQLSSEYLQPCALQCLG